MVEWCRLCPGIFISDWGTKGNYRKGGDRRIFKRVNLGKNMGFG